MTTDMIFDNSGTWNFPKIQYGLQIITGLARAIYKTFEILSLALSISVAIIEDKIEVPYVPNRRVNRR